MDLNLTGKVVVITGGSTGIGKQTALEFAREGCKVAICARTSEKLEAAHMEFEALGFELYTQVVDVTDIPAMKEFSKTVYEKFGSIDIWVNNAGGSYAKRIADINEEDWENQIGINLKAVFFGAQTAAHYMMEGKQGGVIINISSYAFVIPTPPRTLYAAAKTAVTNLTKTFAAEYAPYGIRVISIAPGMVDTELSRMVRKSSGKDDRAWAEDVSLGRLAKTEEIAKPIVFLSSDSSSYVTGVSLEISGGKLCVQKPADSWK